MRLILTGIFFVVILAISVGCHLPRTVALPSAGFAKGEYIGRVTVIGQATDEDGFLYERNVNGYAITGASLSGMCAMNDRRAIYVSYQGGRQVETYYYEYEEYGERDEYEEHSVSGGLVFDVLEEGEENSKGGKKREGASVAFYIGVGLTHRREQYEYFTYPESDDEYTELIPAIQLGGQAEVPVIADWLTFEAFFDWYGFFPTMTLGGGLLFHLTEGVGGPSIAFDLSVSSSAFEFDFDAEPWIASLGIVWR